MVNKINIFPGYTKNFSNIHLNWDFYGLELKVACPIFQSGLHFVSKLDERNQIQYTGADIDILKYIANIMNFKIL